jgi:hypothetical protein
MAGPRHPSAQEQLMPVDPRIQGLLDAKLSTGPSIKELRPPPNTGLKKILYGRHSKDRGL